jgi:uncharacterized protein (TIGR00304 family)
MPDWSFLITIGIIFIILGLLSFAIGMISPALRNKTPEEKAIPARNTDEEAGEKVKGGGVILIGPIPIVFGTDKRYAIIAIILTIALMLAMILLSII